MERIVLELSMKKNTKQCIEQSFFLFDLLLKESVSWNELLFVMFGQLIHCFCLLSSEQYGNATRY
jgi:hypothetical protein